MEPSRSRSDQPAVIVIVGETASGKSALAVELACRFNGEIICADSRTVYRGMDIGTAKPTAAERQGIAHYGLDVVEPNGRFTAYDFQQLAYTAINDSAERGKLPIIVGGTGLYVDSVLYDFHFRPTSDPALRGALELLSVEELRQRLAEVGLPLPENAANKRHLIRMVEAGSTPRQLRQLRRNTLVLGLMIQREALQRRITARAEMMIEHGLFDETQRLYDRYGEIEPLKAPAYTAAKMYIDGIDTVEAVKQHIVRGDLSLAKRQRTWFRRNNGIQWLEHTANRTDQAAAAVQTFLEKNSVHLIQ